MRGGRMRRENPDWMVLVQIGLLFCIFLAGWFTCKNMTKQIPELKPTKQPINITIYVPDRDIKYAQGTLPGLTPKWKIGMKGKL